MEDKTYSFYFHHQNYDHHHDHDYDNEEREYEQRESFLKNDIRSTMVPRTTMGSVSVSKKPYRLTKWRWLALLFMNLLLLGYFAVFDSPQPLETAMKTVLQISDQQYSYLYSFVAVPNLVLPLFAGYLVDAIGVRITMLGFALLVLIGQAVFTYGAYIFNFNIMIIGRVLYSLGADPLNIAQVVMVNRWFKGAEVALGLALGTLFGGVGKAINSIAVPMLYDAYLSIAAPLLFGTILCAISLVCVIIMVIWDKANEERELIYDPEYLSHTEHSEKVNLRDVKRFKPLVWLLVFNFGIIDGVIFTLRSILNDLYHNFYGFSNTAAGNIISVHYIVMALISPLMGKIIDKVGKRASGILFSSVMAVFGFLFYIITPACYQCWTPVIPLILFGVCVGVNDAAVFASLPLVLHEKYLGTGYGFFYVVENLLLFILPPIGGSIKGSFADEITGYFWMLVFLFVLAIVGMLESVALYLHDRKNNSVLDKTVFRQEDPISPNYLMHSNDGDVTPVKKQEKEEAKFVQFTKS